jgi:hypothetical protein
MVANSQGPNQLCREDIYNILKSHVVIIMRCQSKTGKEGNSKTNVKATEDMHKKVHQGLVDSQSQHGAQGQRDQS